MRSALVERHGIVHAGLLMLFTAQPLETSANSRRLAIVLMVALAFAGVALLVFQTTLVPNGFVKLAALVAVGLGAGAALLYRPALVPLAIYLVTIPFEALLSSSDGTLTKLLGIVMTGLILLVLCDRRRAVDPPAAVYWWGGFALLNLFSLMWSEQPFYRLGLFNIMVQIFAIYALFSQLRVTLLEVRIFLGCSLAGGVGLAAIGLWMFTHGTPTASALASARVWVAGGVDPDHFGATLIFPIGLALAGVLFSKSFVRVGFGALFLVLMGGIFVSGTRGALVAVGAMIVYVGVFYGFRIATAAVAGAGFLASLAFPSLWMRINDPSQGEAGSRFSIWRIAWDAMKHHPLLGIGTGQFQLAYSESYLRAASGRMVHQWAEDAHNVLVATGVELGFVGLAILLAAWYFQLRVASVVPRTSKLFAARIACEAATVGLFVDSLSLDIMFRKYVWAAFLVGVLVRNAYLNEHEAYAKAD